MAGATQASARAGADDPSGTFRLDVRIASHTALPFYGSAASATVSTYLVEIERVADAWVQSHRVCTARIEGDSALVRTVLPERFVRSLERRRYPVAIGPRREDGGSWRYLADLGMEHVGVRPVASAAELPEAAGDPAVLDSDGDGRPGATVRLFVPLFEGELYVVQRGRALLEGTLAADGSGTGAVHVTGFGQRVIGARPGFLARTPSIEIDPERSRFTLTPLPDDADCQSLASAERS